MTWPTIPNTFVGGTKAIATQVNADFTALKNAISSRKDHLTSDYTVTDTDGYRVINVTTGNTTRTITLPTAADNDQRIITVTKIDSGTGAVVIDGEGSETVDGQTTFTLDRQYDSATFQCNATAWIRISGGNTPTHGFVGQSSAPSTPGSGLYKTYVSTSDGKLHVVDSSGNDTAVGSGAGSGRNYLSEWFDGVKSVAVTNVGGGVIGTVATANITISTTNWLAYDTSLLTIANVTSAGIRGDAMTNSGAKSLKLDHVSAGAAFVQTPCFQLDLMDYGKPVSVSLDVSGMAGSDDYQVYMVRYNSSGTYQEQILIAGTASATSPYSAQLPTGTAKFQGFFVAGSTTTDYYSLRFYRNDAADTTDVPIDSLYVGPDTVVQGAPVTDWVTSTPTVTNDGSNSTRTNAMKHRQVGDTLEIELYLPWTGAGAAGTLSVTLPNSYAADSTKVGSTAAGMIGTYSWFDNGTNIRTGSVFLASTTTFTFTLDSATTNQLGNEFANGDVLRCKVSVPIVGWSSNVTMANRAVEEYAYSTGTSTAADDTSGFGYGTYGSPFYTITALVAKRVQFTTPILSTDRIILEYTKDSGVTWGEVGSNDADTINKFTRQNTVFYGMHWYGVSGSTTQIDVQFGTYRKVTNTTYAGAGSDWSTLSGSPTTYRWRVRKVSGGAAVGYPISARNIVGDVTGTVTPSGYLGEMPGTEDAGTNGSAYSTRNTTAGTVTAALSILSSKVLNKGTYLVGYNGSFYQNSGSGKEFDYYLDIGGSAVTGTFKKDMTTGTYYSIGFSPIPVVITADSVTVAAKGNFTAAATSAGDLHELYVVRIA